MTTKLLCSSSFYIRYLYIWNIVTSRCFSWTFWIEVDNTALTSLGLSTGHFWATAVSFLIYIFFFFKYAPHNKLKFKLQCTPVWGIRQLKLSYQLNSLTRLFAGISSWLLKWPCRLFFFTSKLNCSFQSGLGKWCRSSGSYYRSKITLLIN